MRKVEYLYDENRSLEKIFLLLTQEKSDEKNSDTEIFTEDELTRIFTLATGLSHWRVALLLLTLPVGRISDEILKELAPYKDQILSKKNLHETNSHGQYILSSRYLRSSETTNLMRLANLKRGFSAPKAFGFKGQLKGSLGRIFVENYERKKETSLYSASGLLKQKQNQIIQTLVKAAKIDAMPASAAAKADVLVYENMLNQWFGQQDLDVYNPLFLIFEVLSMLTDKGWNLEIKKKHAYPGMYGATKVHFDSPKVGKNDEAVYNNKNGLHIKHFEDRSAYLLKRKFSLLSLVIHEFTHLLMKTMNNEMFLLSHQLQFLALDIKAYVESLSGTSPHKDFALFNYFKAYPESQYYHEILPRLFEFYLQNGCFPDETVFPKDIVNQINLILSEFLEKVVDFKNTLLNAKIKLSRVELFSYWEKGEYKNFFAEMKRNFVEPSNCRAIGFFPQFAKEVSVLEQVAAEGYSLNAPNKFKQTPLMTALKESNTTVAAYLMKNLDENQPLTMLI